MTSTASTATMPSESPDDYFRRREAQMRRKVDRLTGPTKAEALAALELRKVVHYPEKGYKMAKTQQQLLDELDEARIVAKFYRRGLGGGGFGAAAFVVMLVCGVLVGQWGSINQIDTGGTATGLILVGIFGTIAALGWTCWWINSHSYDHLNGHNTKRIPSPAARLRAAERAYRNGMLEQS